MPEEGLASQAAAVLDVSDWTTRLRSEVGEPEAAVRLFVEDEWHSPRIKELGDLYTPPVVDAVWKQMASALERLGASEGAVRRLAQAGVEILRLPVSGRALLFLVADIPELGLEQVFGIGDREGTADRGASSMDQGRALVRSAIVAELLRVACRRPELTDYLKRTLLVEYDENSSVHAAIDTRLAFRPGGGHGSDSWVFEDLMVVVSAFQMSLDGAAERLEEHGGHLRFLDLVVSDQAFHNKPWEGLMVFCHLLVGRDDGGYWARVCARPLQPVDEDVITVFPEEMLTAADRGRPIKGQWRLPGKFRATVIMARQMLRNLVGR